MVFLLHRFQLWACEVRPFLVSPEPSGWSLPVGHLIASSAQSLSLLAQTALVSLALMV